MGREAERGDCGVDVEPGRETDGDHQGDELVGRQRAPRQYRCREVNADKGPWERVDEKPCRRVKSGNRVGTRPL